MARTTARRLPKTLRELAFYQHLMLTTISAAAFFNMPQLLVLPDGKRLKWTKKDESKSFDLPWLAYWYSDQKHMADAMRLIMCVVMEQRYDQQKEWFSTWMKLQTG